MNTVDNCFIRIERPKQTTQLQVKDHLSFSISLNFLSNIKEIKYRQQTSFHRFENGLVFAFGARIKLESKPLTSMSLEPYLTFNCD